MTQHPATPEHTAPDPSVQPGTRSASPQTHSCPEQLIGNLADRLADHDRPRRTAVRQGSAGTRRLVADHDGGPRHPLPRLTHRAQFAHPNPRGAALVVDVRTMPSRPADTADSRDGEPPHR